MKIVTVIGARPQFIKAAAVSNKLREKFMEILIHTGQHYDENMSDIFFRELDLPVPDYNLQVGSGSHAKQTADIMVGVEEVLIKEKPDYLLVYGDTNSTLAAALAASKLLIPVVHIEAGLRSFNMEMPEEQNRILTDHISSILFCSTETAVNNLYNENIIDNVYNVGDVMCDSVLYFTKKIKKISQEYFINKLNYLYPWSQVLKKWYLATIHRVENTKNIESIEEILTAFEELDNPVIFPVHPRIRTYINCLCKEKHYKNICFVEPMGYLEMLYFSKNAIKIITDSGGLQKEAYLLETNVVTIREQTEWIETLLGNHNVLCKRNKEEIINAVNRKDIDTEFNKIIYGEGNTGKKICDILKINMKDI